MNGALRDKRKPCKGAVEAHELHQRKTHGVSEQAK